MTLQRPDQPAHQHEREHERGAEHHQPASAVQPHHRSTPVDVIANLAPGSMSFLSIPLTPARRARLDALIVRGFDPVAHILDFLDDELFSTKGQG